MYNKERIEELLQQPRVGYALDELLRLSYCLVVKQLYKFGLQKSPDAISLGYEALYNAIITYDKGSSFKTYATVCIYNSLGCHIRALKTQIIVNTVSYDGALGVDGLPYIESVESSLTADGDILKECESLELRLAFIECYSLLRNDLHKRIVHLWADSGFIMTHVEISKAVGCSQTYVTRMLKEFRRCMKTKLEAL